MVLRIVVGLAAVRIPSVEAAEGGYSNYIPGTYGDFAMALEPAGKLTLRNDTYYYGAEASRAVLSGRAAFDLDLQFLMNFTTLVYKPDLTFGDVQYAFGVFVPFVALDLDSSLGTGGPTFNASDRAEGLGDVAWIPLMLFWNRGNIHAALSQSIVSPTGDYDTDNLINQGLNYWSFDSNVALTYLNENTGQDYSFNLGYIYNTENEDTDYQTGQEIHIDVVANQFLSERFAVGLHGFYLKQITGDSGSGAILGDFKAEAAGIGPALMWGTQLGTQELIFIAKWLAEFDVENRLEGDHVFLSMAMDW